MNRRNFLKFLGTATIGTGIVYSFPSIIVPKNISDRHVSEVVYWHGFGFVEYNEPVFAGFDVRKGVPFYCHRRDLDKLPPWVITRGEITVTYPKLECTKLI